MSCIIETQEQDFKDKDLHGVDFSNQDLSYCNFINANLRRCNFTNATLHFCNFQNADITGAISTGAKTSYSAWLVRVPAGHEDLAATIRRDPRRQGSAQIKSLLDISIVDDNTPPPEDNYEYENNNYELLEK